VTGIAGVGKTTVLNELKNIASEARIKVNVLNFGTVMNEILKELGKDLHRDDMRTQDIDLQRKAQDLAASEISNRAQDRLIVVDTHMFIRTSSGLWSGLPAHVLQKMNPNLLVLIETAPSEILNRRRADYTRTRDQALEKEIAFDLDWSRSTASACSVLTGAPVRIIKNDPGMQRQAAHELLQLIREMSA
jgi:adenylate kinase